MITRDCIAVVTGGASGLGEATVRNIVANGGKAAILDLSVANGNRIVEELGTNVMFVQTNVADEKSVLNALNEVKAKFISFNAVINCAGIGDPKKTVSRGKAHDLESFVKVI